MKKIIYLLLLAVFSHSLMPSAKAQGWEWARYSYGITTDGGMVSTDRKGNVFIGAWANNGTVGTLTFGAITLPPNSSSVYAKYDSAGTLLWALSTIGYGTCLPIGMTNDPSGNLYIFGEFEGGSLSIGSFGLSWSGSAGSVGYGYFLAKVSPSGTVLWATAAGGGPGGSGDIIAFSGVDWSYPQMGGIACDTSGNVYITCSFSGVITIGTDTFTDHGTYGSLYEPLNILIAKYDSTGAVVWAKSAYGDGNDMAMAIAVTPAGSIYIAGASCSKALVFGSDTLDCSAHTTRTYDYLTGTDTGGFQNMFVARYNAAGSAVWAATANNGNGQDAATSIAADNLGNVYLTGCFADSSIAFDDSVITSTSPTPSYASLYLFKIDSFNHLNWHKQIYGMGVYNPGYGADNYVFAEGVSTDNCGHVWVGGNMGDSANIDGAILGNQWVLENSTIESFAPLPSGTFIAGYDEASGSVMGYSSLDQGGDDWNQIACDSFGNVYFSDDFYGLFIVDGDTINVAPTLGGGGHTGENLFVAKYSYSPFIFDTLKNDTAFCLKDSAVLTANPGAQSYVWNDGDTGQSRTVHIPGTYWVHGIDNCARLYVSDTFLAKKNDSLSHSSDTSACATVGSITLSGDADYLFYLWNTGDTTATLPVSHSGTYWVYNDGTCKTYIDTFVVDMIIPDTTHTTYDTSVCSTVGSVTLIAPSSYLSYLWNTGSTTPLLFESGGGTFWVYDNGSCSTFIDTFVVGTTIPDTTHATRDTSACSTVGSITLSGGAGYISYLWNTGDTTATLPVTSSGAYYVYDNSRCRTRIDTFAVSIKTPVFPAFTDAITNNCPPYTVSFINSSGAGSSSATYTWLFGDGASYTGAIPSVHSYDDSGVYTITLIMIDSNACKSPDTVSQTISLSGYNNIIPNFTYLLEDSCAPYTVLFTNASTDTISGASPIYNWYYGDGAAYSGANPPAWNYPVAGNYTVTLVMADSKACVSPDTVSKTISINSLRVSANFTAPDSICEGIPVIITNNSVNATGANWNFGNGQTSTAINPTYTYDTSGTFAITLIASNTGSCYQNDTVSKTIIIMAGAVANFTFTPIVSELNTPVSFINLSINALRYLWNFGDGTTGTEENPVHTYSKTATWNVCLQAFNTSDCPSQICKEVATDIEPAIGLPSGFSPNGDGENDILYVRGDAIQTLDLKIWNRWGQLVFETTDQSRGWDGTFNGQPQPIDAYAYVLIATFLDGSTQTLKGNVTLLR